MNPIRDKQDTWSRFKVLPIIFVYAALIGAFLLAAPKAFTGYRIYMSFLQTIPPSSRWPWD